MYVLRASTRGEALAVGYGKWGKLDARRICADHQLAKFYRELKSWMPSMFDMSKAKSLALDELANGLLIAIII